MSQSILRFSSSDPCMYKRTRDINACCTFCNANPSKCKPVYNTNLKKSFNDTSMTKKQRYSYQVNNAKYTTIFPFKDYDITKIQNGNLGSCDDGINCNTSKTLSTILQYNSMFGIYKNSNCFPKIPK
jgi:hypothetical protein